VVPGASYPGAMRAWGLSPLGSGGKVVEADETFYGFLEGQPKKGRRAWSNKNVVFSLVEHGGSASFHVNGVRAGDLLPIIRGNLSRKAKLNADEMHSHKFMAEVENLNHRAVTHACRRLLFNLQTRYEGRAPCTCTAKRSTFTATCRNLTSVIPTAPRSALMMGNGERLRSKARRASLVRRVRSFGAGTRVQGIKAVPLDFHIVFGQVRTAHKCSSGLTPRPISRHSLQGLNTR
jgi:hypothetical protein